MENAKERKKVARAADEGIEGWKSEWERMI